MGLVVVVISNFPDRHIVFLCALWSMLWLSLNSESAINDGSPIYYIHTMRFFLPYIAAVLAIVWMCCHRYSPHFQSWHYGILGYAGTVIISGLLAGTEFTVLHFHMSMICAVVVTIVGTTISRQSNNITEQKIITVLAFNGLVILCCVLTIFFLRDIMHAISLGSFNGYAVQPSIPQQFSMEAPRPTGIARTAAVMGLVCGILYCVTNSGRRMLGFLTCFCLALILFYQARGTILGLLVAIPLVFLALPSSRWPHFKSIAKAILATSALYFSILLVIYLGVSLSAPAGFANHIISEEFYRDLNPDSFGSGRLESWMIAFDFIFSHPFLGKGSQADRLYLEVNVSNAYIYALMCGGLTGVVFASISLLKVLKNICAIAFQKQSLKHSNFDTGAVLAIGVFSFLAARGLVENSFALFNIDFLLAIPTIWYLNSKNDMCSTENNNDYC